jgi:hypothetical protein
MQELRLDARSRAVMVSGPDCLAVLCLVQIFAFVARNEEKRSKGEVFFGF